MNGNEDNSCCCFHPKQVVIGVCHLCLNERLLVLASKQAHSSSSTRSGRQRFLQKKPHIHLHKIFALGSLLHLRQLKQGENSKDSDDHDASTSQEDSFISIKFEDTGVGSWEKGKVSKVSLETCSMSWNPKLGNKSVIEHPKLSVSLRWRKRMGHLFQLVRWKRSTDKAEGVKAMKKNWILRTLTKRS